MKEKLLLALMLVLAATWLACDEGTTRVVIQECTDPALGPSIDPCPTDDDDDDDDDEGIPPDVNPPYRPCMRCHG